MKLSGSNCRRGFFRIWVVLSVLWLVAVGFSYADNIQMSFKEHAAPCKDGSKSCNPWERDWGNTPPDTSAFVVQAPDGKVIEFPKEMTKGEVENTMRRLYLVSSPHSQIIHVLILALSFPAVTIGFWLAGNWIFAGFKGKKLN